MPKLTVESYGTFNVPTGKRLVLALMEEAGVDQLHACGGNCKCTTCTLNSLRANRARNHPKRKRKNSLKKD